MDRVGRYGIPRSWTQKRAWEIVSSGVGPLAAGLLALREMEDDWETTGAPEIKKTGDDPPASA